MRRYDHDKPVDTSAMGWLGIIMLIASVLIAIGMYNI